MTNRRLLVVGLWLVGATAGLAATVTIDLNGFTSTVGGQVTGPGLDRPIPMPRFAPTVVLSDLQAEQTYRVDFFHDDTSAGNSDFDFVVAADGKGVASVSLHGGVYQGLDGFQPGDRTLKLKTFTITMLRYDLAKPQFHFVTTGGPSQIVTGAAEGLADDGVTPLKVKVTATITGPPAK